MTIRTRIILALGGLCVRCGFSDIRALQIDHVHADAKLDKVKKGISYYYQTMKNLHSGRYQVLCANCNTIKRRENQECPLYGADGPNPSRMALCVKG